jgi:hypothetical protein
MFSGRFEIVSRTTRFKDAAIANGRADKQSVKADYAGGEPCSRAAPLFCRRNGVNANPCVRQVISRPAIAAHFDLHHERWVGLSEILVVAKEKVERRARDAEDARVSRGAEGLDHAFARSIEKGAFGGGAGQGVRCCGGLGDQRFRFGNGFCGRTFLKKLADKLRPSRKVRRLIQRLACDWPY